MCEIAMRKTIRGVKTWVKGGPGHGFLDVDNCPIDIPDIEWDHVDQIELNDVDFVGMDYTGPYIAGVETYRFKHPVSCIIDEGEYKDDQKIRAGSMICRKNLDTK